MSGTSLSSPGILLATMPYLGLEPRSGTMTIGNDQDPIPSFVCLSPCTGQAKPDALAVTISSAAAMMTGITTYLGG